MRRVLQAIGLLAAGALLGWAIGGVWAAIDYAGLLEAWESAAPVKAVRSWVPEISVVVKLDPIVAPIEHAEEPGIEPPAILLPEIHVRAAKRTMRPTKFERLLEKTETIQFPAVRLGTNGSPIID